MINFDFVQKPEYCQVLLEMNCENTCKFKTKKRRTSPRIHWIQPISPSPLTQFVVHLLNSFVIIFQWNLDKYAFTFLKFRVLCIKHLEKYHKMPKIKKIYILSYTYIQVNVSKYDTILTSLILCIKNILRNFVKIYKLVVASCDTNKSQKLHLIQYVMHPHVLHHRILIGLFKIMHVIGMSI